MFSVVLGLMSLAPARLWVSGDLFVASDGRVWARGKADGQPAVKPFETRLTILDAASWKDGGFTVAVKSDGTCVVAKITPVDGKPPVVNRGFSRPGVLSSQDLSVQPFGSGDVVVHPRGSQTAWLYSKSTYWTEVASDAGRASGVVQGGVLFFAAYGSDFAMVCRDPLAKYSPAHVAADFSAFRLRACSPNQGLVQTDSTESYVLADRTTQLATLYPVAKGEAVALGKLPDPHAVVYRTKDGTPYFAWLSAAGKLVTRQTGEK
jgi:hypothetical protein